MVGKAWQEENGCNDEWYKEGDKSKCGVGAVVVTVDESDKIEYMYGTYGAANG